MQLKGLLSVVSLASQGKDLQKITLSSLAPASAKQVEKLKTRLCITKKQDYPITTNFPHALEVLKVARLSLKKIDSRILKLQRLRILDLTQNHIRALPGNFDQATQLSELHLSGNLLDDIPREFCESSLQHTLTSLDLSHNKLRVLRPHIGKLQALVTLKLSHNQLVYLPHCMGAMARLKFFSASHNQLKTLPASFTQLQLESLDLFGNPFLEDGPDTCIERLHFPTLLEVAGRAIRKLRFVWRKQFCFQCLYFG